MKRPSAIDYCGVCGYTFGIEMVCPECGHERSELSRKDCLATYGTIQMNSLLNLLEEKGLFQSPDVAGQEGGRKQNPFFQLLVDKGIITEEEHKQLWKDK